jgi:hypothetical protein
MIRATCALARLVALIAALAFTDGAAPKGASADERYPGVRVMDPWAAAAVRRAMPRVRQRLADPDCRKVLSDFADARGSRLHTVLEARGLTPEDHLGKILFYDGSDLETCRTRKVLAVTSPGGHIVQVCGRRLRRLPAAGVETVILHEMLHTLGLGEDPPTSAAITAQVAFRCGTTH